MHFTAIFRATASGFSNEVPNYLFYPNSRGGNLTRNCGLFYSICTVIFLATLLSNIRKRLLCPFRPCNTFSVTSTIFLAIFSSIHRPPSFTASPWTRAVSPAWWDSCTLWTDASHQRDSWHWQTIPPWRTWPYSSPSQPWRQCSSWTWWGRKLHLFYSRKIFAP